MKDKALDLLIYSLDNELTVTEQAVLAQYLEDSEELRTEKEKLLIMRTALSELKIRDKSILADNILQSIYTETKEPEFQRIIMQLFPKVAAACILITAATLFATYIYLGSLSPEALVGIENLSPEDAYSLMSY